jgi:hypothetical protein
LQLEIRDLFKLLVQQADVITFIHVCSSKKKKINFRVIFIEGQGKQAERINQFFINIFNSNEASSNSCLASLPVYRPTHK